MTDLILNQNAFTGRVDLRQLPPSMKVLRLNNNQLEHITGLESLPPQLQRLSVEQNKELVGEFNKALFPTSLNEFNFHETLLKQM
eukprot:CAMPEP_0201499650 /NCGR_PEP_ID=MMETSP0151_2-20130828/77139_1 /ASSEMBLY_ACC=CAM_ASM_000257 /TAXON_ID=200890 /ORGANISM="Paramoeba atlantica, Strain 621/1 / CCAP 1560/9" /LENGTH=84 /DNA_ID=CAMNT_0047892157 /DNA_START=268 /DNA_END=522 /DNA_ORIENTATION=-